jgi:hypothetical protein
MSENEWAFPVVEALHVIGMALFLGPILLGDLSVLGAIPRLPAVRLPRAGIVLVLTTGVLLFTANSGRYVRNPAFLLKIGLLLAAIAAHAVLHGRGTRATAALSLALWSLAIVAGRAVIDFDV